MQKVSIPRITVPINRGPGEGILYLSYLEIQNFDAPTIQIGTTDYIVASVNFYLFNNLILFF
jgi:hypothetical protein